MPNFCQALLDARAKGLKFYENGRPCPKGHVGRRWVSNQCCADCAKEIGKRKVKGVKAHYHPLCAIWKAAKASSDRADFLKRFPGQYSAAHKRGLMKLICGHMPPSKTGAKWTFCRVYNLAQNYSVQGDFKDRHSGAWSFAVDRGYWPFISSHMDRLNSDYDAVYAWGFWRGDSLICKFGVTSERLGMQRINSVSQKSGLPVEFAIIAKSSAALDAENRLKRIGHKEPMNGFNGASEFRRMKRGDLTKAYEVIYGYADGTT